MEFDELLREHRSILTRYVRFRLPASADTDDVVQDICLSAYRNFSQLQSEQAFKPWLLSIARNKCRDYFRRRARTPEIPLSDQVQRRLTASRIGSRLPAVRDTLSQLSEQESQILYLYYFEELPQQDIAARLNLPLGTVKSRLHAARERFRMRYPYPPRSRKGENTMFKSILPETMPTYQIEPSPLAPFPVKCEEMPGWMIIPRPGEKCTWGNYDMPTRRLTEYAEMQVTGRAQVHDIEGVEISSTQYDLCDYYRTSRIETIERRFIAQLTDTHFRILAESHVEDGVRKLTTFLDESFLDCWGFGSDNCGNEINLSPRGLLRREGSVVTGEANSETFDVVGRYTVTLDGRRFDTVCLMYFTCENGEATEHYIDQTGHTVLWRRFNRDDWKIARYGQRWSERLPDSDRLTINGELFVHWYDSITDYVL